MANIKSQMKRNRQNLTRHARNKAVQSEIKTRVKKVITAVEAGEPADELYREAQQKIDVAVAKGVLKRGTAARKKSRLAQKLSATS